MSKLHFTQSQYEAALRLARDIGDHHQSHREIAEALIRFHPDQNDVVLILAHGEAAGRRFNSMRVDDEPGWPRSQTEALQRLLRFRNIDPKKRYFNDLADTFESNLPKYPPPTNHI